MGVHGGKGEKVILHSLQGNFGVESEYNGGQVEYSGVLFEYR
jgi:hypothetical protein